MPVYCVRVNNYTRHGVVRHGPELMGIAFEPTVKAAIDWTLSDQDDLRIRDVEVDVLSTRNDCWYQSGPEETQ